MFMVGKDEIDGVSTCSVGVGTEHVCCNCVKRHAEEAEPEKRLTKILRKNDLNGYTTHITSLRNIIFA